MYQSIKYLFLFVSLILCICSSCDRHKGQNTQLDLSKAEFIDFFSSYKEKIPFSAFVDTIELIPLETTNDCLIGNVNRVIFANDKYYIRATRSKQNGVILVFDKNGLFLWRLDKRGQGPDEYINLDDFAIQDQQLFAASYRKIQVYDSIGNYLKTIKIGDLSTKEILSAPSNKLLILNFVSVRHANNLLTLVDEKGVEKKFFDVGKIRATRSSQRINSNSICYHSPFYYVNNPFENVVFSIAENNMEDIKPVYYMDYGSKNIDKIEVTEDDDFMSWLKKLETTDDYMTIVSFGVSDDYLFAGSTDNLYNGYLTLYSKKTKNSLSARKLVDDMFLKGNVIPITAKRIPHNMDGNDIIWEMEPEILINGFKQHWSNLSEPRREAFKRDYAEWYRICTSLKEDDNPVLMRIKVKDF